MEIATQEIARRLHLEGHDVRVFVARAPEGCPTNETVDGVSVTRLISQTLYAQDASSLQRWMRYSARLVFAFTHLLRAFARWRPDVLHTSITPDLVLSVIVIGAFLRTPIVVSAYGSDLRSLSDQPWYGRRITRLILARSDYVVTVSKDLETIARELVPGVTEKHEMIPSGVDYAFFVSEHNVPTTRHPYLLTVGAIKHVKGHDVLLRAFAHVLERYPHYHLVLVGQGALYAQMVDLAKELGIRQQVHFWGVAGREELAGLLYGCQLFVMASRSEGMPLSLLEAFASGKAVVATSVGGVGEIVVDGETGILVEPEKDQELAQGIISLLGDPEMRTRMGRRAREIARAYDWDTIAQSYARVFLNVAGSAQE